MIYEYFYSVEDTKKYIKNNAEKVAEVISALPPLTIPKKIDINSVQYPAIIVPAKYGLRAQYYGEFMFDESDRIVLRRPEVNDDYHSWGVISYKHKKCSEEEIRAALAAGDISSFRFSECENIFYNRRYTDKDIYSSHPFSHIGLIKNRQDLLDYKPGRDIAGLYLFRPGGYYEMGYLGHQSESLCYLPYQTEKCPLLQNVNENTNIYTWRDGRPFTAKSNCEKYLFGSEFGNIMYLDADESGLPISSYYY